MKQFRDRGAIGALLDEYERAVLDLKNVIVDINETSLCQIVDAETKDEDCRSIQTILTHVVRAGYCYVVEIRRFLGEDLDFLKEEYLKSAAAYHSALNAMFEYTDKLFEDYPNIQLEENNAGKKMIVKWGQSYDVEQLMEHAIVHVLRHRRQVERFLIRMNSDKI